MMFGLQRKSTKEKSPRPSASQSSFKYALNIFDECVSVQEKSNRWSKEHVNTSKGESGPKRQHFQFDVQQFCDNLVKGVDKALKDVNKIQKKSTSTRASLPEPSLFISKKPQGESENPFEKLKDFSDSLPILDETDEELIESLITCEDKCDLPSLEPEFVFDNEQAIVELTVLQPELPSSLVSSPQVFEEEPLDFPHQCPCLDTWISLDEVPGPIFDEEDEPDPVFDEEATSITSISMESQLCFDSGISPAPLSSELQEHCEEPYLINSLPDMLDKISSHDLIRFGLDKMKEFCVSNSVFENMINSFKIFEPEKLLDQPHFQNVNGINSGIILSFDQFLKHNKGFHPLEKSFDLDWQQTNFCARKSFDSIVSIGIGFDLSSSRHALITDYLFAPSYALCGILNQKLVEIKSLDFETDFGDLDLCDSVLQPHPVCSETDKTGHFIRSSRDNCVVLSVDDILVYNTFFEKCFETLIVDSQSELKLVCSDVEQDMNVLKISNIVACLEKILVCNVYFDEHLERLRYVLVVLGKDILMFDLNKYLSCTFDPGLLVFVLSIQEIQVQPLRNESIDHSKHPQIWRCIVVQTGYLADASDRGSVQGRYLGHQKVFCFESNFPGKPTHQEITEAWNRMKSFKDEDVMNFPNRRFSSPSICKYQISKGDSCPRKERPEPKPILHEPKVFPQSTSSQNQKHFVLNEQDKHDHFPRRASTDGCQRTWNFLMKKTSKLQGSFCPIFSFTEFSLNVKSFVSDLFPFDTGTIDLRTNPFEEGGNDVPQSNEPDKTDMHGLIMESSNDICSLFNSCLPNHEAYKHEITWRMCSTQLWSSSKKNQIKRSSYMGVMLFTNQVIFSSHEFRHMRILVSWTDTTLELNELSELGDTTLELSELSDTILELNELSNTHDGAGIAAGRNGPFQPKEKFIKTSLWICFFPNSTSSFLSPFQAHSH